MGEKDFWRGSVERKGLRSLWSVGGRAWESLLKGF